MSEKVSRSLSTFVLSFETSGRLLRMSEIRSVMGQLIFSRHFCVLSTMNSRTMCAQSTIFTNATTYADETRRDATIFSSSELQDDT